MRFDNKIIMIEGIFFLIQDNAETPRDFSNAVIAYNACQCADKTFEFIFIGIVNIEGRNEIVFPRPEMKRRKPLPQYSFQFDHPEIHKWNLQKIVLVSQT